MAVAFPRSWSIPVLAGPRGQGPAPDPSSTSYETVVDKSENVRFAAVPSTNKFYPTGKYGGGEISRSIHRTAPGVLDDDRSRSGRVSVGCRPKISSPEDRPDRGTDQSDNVVVARCG